MNKTITTLNNKSIRQKVKVKKRNRMMKKGHIASPSLNDLFVDGFTKLIDENIQGYTGKDYRKDIAQKMRKMIQEGELDLDSPFESIILSRDVLFTIKIAFRHLIPDDKERGSYAIWWGWRTIDNDVTDLFEFHRDVNGVLTRKDYKSSDVDYHEKIARRVKIDRLEEGDDDA